MIVSDEEKKQILLASKEELDKTEIQYARASGVYPKVLNYIYTLAQQCKQTRLPDEIRELKLRPAQLKDPDATKEKILRRRIEGWKKGDPERKKYNFQSVTDIIGLKIICGYLSDQPRIEQWIRETFDVRKFEPVTYARGYKAWHYIIRLKEDQKNIPNNWKSVPCEIQVKTLLQAAWDEKTHDLVYKKQDVSEFEQRQFALLSESLHVADRQSEMIRLEIEESRKEEEQRRHAALQVYFASAEETAAPMGLKIEKRIPNKQIKEIINKIEIKLKEIDQIRDLTTSKEEEVKLLVLGVRLTLETSCNEAKEWTSNYANQLLNKHPDDAYICRVISTAYWALELKYESLETVIMALENAERENDDGEKNKAIRALLHFIADYGRDDLRYLGERLLKELKDSAAELETKALFLIKMAESEAEIEEGITCLHRSLETAEESSDEVLKKTATVFCELDHSIAGRKRKGLLLAKKMESFSNSEDQSDI